jgi:hypothetical protein
VSHFQSFIAIDFVFLRIDDHIRRQMFLPKKLMGFHTGLSAISVVEPVNRFGHG